MGRFRRELRTSMRPESTAVLLDRGVTRGVIDGPRWRQTSRGFHVAADRADRSPTQRILEAAAIMPPDAALGGWAAAYALGADWLDGLNNYTMRPLPLTVLMPPSAHRRSTPTLHYVRAELAPRDVVTLAGIRFTHRLRTAYDLARWAPDLAQAVVALDAMLAARVVTVSRLTSSLPELTGSRGARQARRAVELCRWGVKSPGESRLRMMYVHELGHPVPMVNQPTFDLTGTFLGAPDLLDVEAGLVLEYDGTRWAGSSVTFGHRDVDQHREDNAREEGFERANLIVVRADKGDMTRHRRRLAARIEAARVDGLARDRSRDGWTLRQPATWFGLPG